MLARHNSPSRADCAAGGPSLIAQGRFRRTLRTRTAASRGARRPSQVTVELASWEARSAAVTL